MTLTAKSLVLGGKAVTSWDQITGSALTDEEKELFRHLKIIDNELVIDVPVDITGLKTVTGEESEATALADPPKPVPLFADLATALATQPAAKYIVKNGDSYSFAREGEIFGRGLYTPREIGVTREDGSAVLTFILSGALTPKNPVSVAAPTLPNDPPFITKEEAEADVDSTIGQIVQNTKMHFIMMENDIDRFTDLRQVRDNVTSAKMRTGLSIRSGKAMIWEHSSPRI
jgi:hypothetical protein